MMKKILPIALLSAFVAFCTSCNNGGQFKKVKGIEYKIVKKGTGKTKAQIGDIVEFHILAKVDTQVLGDSRKQPDGKPAVTRVDSVKAPGQWQAVLPMLAEGDSAVLQIWCDSMLKGIPPQQQQLPPWLVKGNKVMIYLKVVGIKSMEEYQKEMKVKQEQMQKEMQEKAALQAPVDDKIIQDYLAKNNIKAQKTALGVYYVIHKDGKGELIQKGQKVTSVYTGRTLEGKIFDTNADSTKGHKEPFSFTVGTGMVIPGWDDGAQVLKKGSKATLYVPSQLAYGPRGAGGEIGPNTVLMFDMEITDVQAGQKEGGPMEQQGAQMKPKKSK